MKTVISVLVLTLSALGTIVGADNSLAGEVVFCVSQERETAVLMDAKGLCVEGQNEYVISGPGLERSKELAVLAVFSDNKNCDEDSTGTTTRVGFDNNDNGILDADEVMTISGTCIASVEDESEDLGKR